MVLIQGLKESGVFSNVIKSVSKASSDSKRNLSSEEGKSANGSSTMSLTTASIKFQAAARKMFARLHSADPDIYKVARALETLNRFENDVDVGEEVVLMTTKGEAIALGITEMSTVLVIMGLWRRLRG